MANDRKVVTPAELVEILDARHGAAPVTIVSRTDPRMVKKDRVTGKANPFTTKGKWSPDKDISKVARANGMINFKYEDGVNRQREREGKSPDFVAEPRTWGTKGFDEKNRVETFVKKDENLYLEVKVQRFFGAHFVFPNGMIIPKDFLKGYLPISREPENQGVDAPSIIRDYALKNIVELTLDGVTYIVNHEMHKHTLFRLQCNQQVELSTKHLPDEDRAKLFNAKFMKGVELNIYTNENGACISLPQSGQEFHAMTDKLRQFGFTAYCISILQLCYNDGVRMLVLDANGPVRKYLPIFVEAVA